MGAISIVTTLCSSYTYFYNYLCVFVELLKSNTAYEEKQQVGNATEKTMLELLWDVNTLKRLNEKGRTLRTDISIAQDLLHHPEPE